MLPLRKVIPSLGQLDTATLVLAWLVAVVKMLLIQQLFLGQVGISSALVAGLIILLKETLSLVFWIVIIRAILSWFSQGRNPIEQVMHQLTEPLLRPIRRVIPPLGGLDLSVLVVLIGLQFIQILLGDVLRGF